MFSQNFSQFAGSKTNLLGVAIILAALFGVVSGQLPTEQALEYFGYGGSLLTVRDAIAKVERNVTNGSPAPTNTGHNNPDG